MALREMDAGLLGFWAFGLLGFWAFGLYRVELLFTDIHRVHLFSGIGLRRGYCAMFPTHLLAALTLSIDSYCPFNTARRVAVSSFPSIINNAGANRIAPVHPHA